MEAFLGGRSKVSFVKTSVLTSTDGGNTFEDKKVDVVVDDEGNKQSMELPMTFADFAVQEGRFRKHFRKAPQDTWNENMVPLAEFLDIEEDDREGLFPYIWAVDKKNRLMRVLVSQEIVKSTEERRHFWRTLKGIAGLTKKVDPDQIASQIGRAHV